MSDLPAASMSYHVVVTEYFLTLRGAGLMVSPLDAELVVEWERRGIPVAVVCRGLKRGMEEGAEPRPPRSIRALRLAVEDEWRAYRSGRVGDSREPPSELRAAEARLDAARALLAELDRTTSDGPRREAYREARRALSASFDGSPLARAEAALAAADARIVGAWLRSLPRGERAALGPRVRLMAGHRPRGASLRAYRDALRAHLLDTARAAGLSCLRGSL